MKLCIASVLAGVEGVARAGDPTNLTTMCLVCSYVF